MATKKKNAKRKITPTATHRLLGDIQNALAKQAKTGRPMEQHQAAAYANILQRIREDEAIVAALAEYDQPINLKTPDLRRKELAYYVFLVKKLIGNGAPKFVVDNWKHSKDKISAIRTYSRDEKPYVQGMWQRATLNANGESDQDVALAELKFWELTAPSEQLIWDKKKKKSS